MAEQLIEVCCAEFAKQAELQAFVGGGSLYPQSAHPVAQIEPSEETGLWDVNGCCGGGCFVLNNLKYCPWCGKDISKSKDTKEG